SAAAKFKAVFASGGELHFCGHHAHEHEAKLLEQDVDLRAVA
ncbi:MAG: DUF7455 domain-containing protein, partial [Pseudonocardia sp.]